MDSFGKQNKTTAQKRKTALLVEPFFVRAVDICVFAEVALVSLRNDEVVATEF